MSQTKKNKRSISIKLPKNRDLRLEIEPVIAKSKKICEEIQQQLAQHEGLQRVSQQVSEAATKSKSAAKQNSFFSIHRLPGYMFILLLIWSAWWVYYDFVVTPQISIALSDRDTQNIVEVMSGQVGINIVNCNGSSHGLEMLYDKKVDITFVQGGVDFPNQYQRFILPEKELIIFLVRDGLKKHQVKRVCTSVKNQGSHTLSQRCLKVMGMQVTFTHDWPRLVENEEFILPPDVDAVIVVKSMEEKNMAAIRSLVDKGFRFRTVDLGVWGDTKSYLQKIKLSKGYILKNPFAPQMTVQSYWVHRYVVANPHIRTAHVKNIARALYPTNLEISPERESVVNDSLQKADAFTETFIGVAMILMSLFGLSVYSFRQRFNELNTLVSLLNMLQSSKDLHGELDHELRTQYILYLAYCSDLLSIIDIVTGYYAQENSALMFNGFCSTIHQRCSHLKLNIQLKIQHATLK
ncbi:hypothetical protein [Candidatus Uabimicrobium amorphum]|uniref:Uncharacterized protein n=1 Tax=Uabimicrobium amorphum TaxID=2596890 RepID=A0A5S9IHZ5_UABAM|nr:hypothetical protein [Candidatus Uabimicrobium amorphum]BBM82169.1 hypothetical protein UABAM_00512 [Candidatus Uabimicrobium amorphum]